jgi:hypothetical protein
VGEREDDADPSQPREDCGCPGYLDGRLLGPAPEEREVKEFTMWIRMANGTAWHAMSSRGGHPTTRCDGEWILASDGNSFSLDPPLMSKCESCCRLSAQDLLGVVTVDIGDTDIDDFEDEEETSEWELE